MKLKKTVCSVFLISSLFCSSAFALNNSDLDTIPGGFSRSPEWFAGPEAEVDYVIPTDAFYQGSNPEGSPIRASLGIAFKGGFRFNPDTKEGMLYKGLYQGVGVGLKTFMHQELMGKPAMFYVFQGAPFHHFGSRFHLGYEWKFGVAVGWHHEQVTANDGFAHTLSTAITAHMGIALKMSYDLTDRWSLALALEGIHHSNGNTSWRNAGLNAAGLSLGVSYIFNPQLQTISTSPELTEEADRKKWFIDVMGFGAWRQRIIHIDPCEAIPNPAPSYLVPGKYAVAGVQVAPTISLNRWVAVGPAFDLIWDKSNALQAHWIEMPWEEGMYFTPVSFKEQISAGISAHAELTTPIFAVNAGIGYNFINPKGDIAFYQSLTVKTFLTKNLYLNFGYRLAGFKDPHHLMLGVGYRFRL